MTDPEIRLAAIHVYPIKSLRGVRLDVATLDDGRLASDRRWLLVDEAGRFLHQRDHPQMARIGVTLAAHGVVLQADGLPDFALPAPDTTPDTVAALTHVRIWRRRVPLRPVGPAADAWFSAALGVSSRLMIHATEHQALDAPDDERQSTLHDATPFHVTTTASLADLNHRLARPIPMDRFRPNLVLAGSLAYAEDGWRRCEIGGIAFRWLRPCVRCAITTTDQATGLRGTEPLRTLGTYRRTESAVVFGHYAVAEQRRGQLHVGDAVTVS